MQKGITGFLSGIIAGLIQLVIEQILFVSNISEANIPGIISRILNFIFILVPQVQIKLPLLLQLFLAHLK